jgi:hypothetical protein
MWFQLGERIAGGNRIQKCANDDCAKVLLIGRGGRRTNARFCENNNQCKMNHHRERKVRARQLIAAGQSLSDAAGELSVSVNQVRKWVKEGDRKRGRPRKG